MKKKIKCQYCGKSYNVLDPHDCCPSCGAFNEFDLKEEKNTGNTVVRIVKIIFLAPFLFLIFLLIVGLIIDRVDRSYDYDYYYGSNEKRVDWDSYTKETGTFIEMLEKYNLLDDELKGFLDTTISVDYKDTLGNATLYIDNIKFSYSGPYSSFATVDINLETKKGDNNLPKSIDLYLVNDNTRHRLSEEKDWFCYGSDAKTLEELLKEDFSGSSHWNVSISDFCIYDYLEIVIDDKDPIKVLLNYNDTATSISYYFYKE